MSEVKTEEFVSSEALGGKKFKEQTGNNLFQQIIARRFDAARELMKANPRPLTPSQRKCKVKNRAKRKARR